MPPPSVLSGGGSPDGGGGASSWTAMLLCNNVLCKMEDVSGWWVEVEARRQSYEGSSKLQSAGLLAFSLVGALPNQIRKNRVLKSA